MPKEQVKDSWQRQLELAGVAWGGFFCRLTEGDQAAAMSAARRTDAIADRATMNDSGSKTPEQGLKPAHKKTRWPWA